MQDRDLMDEMRRSLGDSENVLDAAQQESNQLLQVFL
jgi:hypothetical protein